MEIKTFCACLALMYAGNIVAMDYDEDDLYANPWADMPSTSKASKKGKTTQTEANKFAASDEKSGEKEPTARKVPLVKEMSDEKNQAAEKKYEDLRATYDEVVAMIKSGSWEKRKEFFVPLGELLESGKEINLNENSDKNQKRLQSIIIFSNLVDLTSINQLILSWKNKIPLERGAINKLIGSDFKNIRDLIVSCQVKYYATPLFYACDIGNKDVVQYFVKLGMDINKVNNDGETPLFNACRSGNKDLVQYLVEHGADINKKNNDGEISLTYACTSGNKDLVQYLVEHGADVNKGGETSLSYACTSGNKDLVQYLVELGVGIDKQDKSGETPLMYACTNGNKDIVQYLVEQGADINKEDWNKETSLFNACRSGNKNIVQYLVEHGANIKHKSWSEETALDISRQEGHDQIADYLEQKLAEYI